MRDMVRGNEHIPGVCGHGSGQSRRRASARRGCGDAYPALHIFAKEKETPSGRNEIFIHGGGADGALPGFRNADDTANVLAEENTALQAAQTDCKAQCQQAEADCRRKAQLEADRQAKTRQRPALEQAAADAGVQHIVVHDTAAFR